MINQIIRTLVGNETETTGTHTITMALGDMLFIVIIVSVLVMILVLLLLDHRDISESRDYWQQQAIARWNPDEDETSQEDKVILTCPYTSNNCGPSCIALTYNKETQRLECDVFLRPVIVNQDEYDKMSDTFDLESGED